jgi:Predicted GTPases
MADSGEGIDDLFNEITALAQNCKYPDCAHNNEPGCQVRAAIKSGKLDENKYKNYADLKKKPNITGQPNWKGGKKTAGSENSSRRSKTN